jgi:glycosyltransferase involved in cell wall biosynthesis
MRSAPLNESPKKEWPQVSLITPSYNAGPYLRAAIDSVLSQDYPNIEYLVMDGGSTDGSVELLREYGAGVRWVSEKDAGQSDAIARGFEQTGGTILGWLNADDELKPGAVRSAVETFQENPKAALIYGNADFIDADGGILGPCTVVEPYSGHRLLHYGDYIIQPAAFFTRQAYEAVGGLNKSLNWAMDWDLWIRLAQGYDVVYIDKLLASYRWLGSNKTAEGGFDRLEEIDTVARQYGCHGLPAYFRLEQARLFALQASQNLKQRQLVPMLKNLAKSATTVLTSWGATTSLFTPHVWRNYRTAQMLYRHVEELRSDRS